MARPNWEYIRVDVLLPEHPKVEGLSDKAFRALIELWCYCGRNRTDGAVTAKRWRQWPSRVRDELAAAGLVDLGSGDEVAIHDFTGPDGHQRTRQEIDDLSARRAEAGRKGGSVRRSNPEANASASGQANASARAKHTAEAEAEAEARDNPPDAPTARRPPKGARGTRLPDDFAVTADMAAWARRDFPEIDYLSETMRFRDHFASASGPNARKVKWDAAWRNWIRRAADMKPNGQQSTTNDRVRQAIETGKRVQAMLNGEL